VEANELRMKGTETQRGPGQSEMIRGQTTKLKNEFLCLTPDCPGPLCVSVPFIRNAYCPL